jgi:hypothetical protein
MSILISFFGLKNYICAAKITCFSRFCKYFCHFLHFFSIFPHFPPIFPHFCSIFPYFCPIFRISTENPSDFKPLPTENLSFPSQFRQNKRTPQTPRKPKFLPQNRNLKEYIYCIRPPSAHPQPPENKQISRLLSNLEAPRLKRDRRHTGRPSSADDSGSNGGNGGNDDEGGALEG